MPEALEPVEQLVARANAAIAEAQRLVEAHREFAAIGADEDTSSIFPRYVSSEGAEVAFAS